MHNQKPVSLFLGNQNPIIGREDVCGEREAVPNSIVYEITRSAVLIVEVEFKYLATSDQFNVIFVSFKLKYEIQ